MQGIIKRFVRLPSHLFLNVFVGLGFLLIVLPGAPESNNTNSTSTIVDDTEVDRQLLQSAMGALNGRSGSVIVLDPQTGRIRAMVNSRLAFEEAMPPGSTIKPFTSLAALRQGVIDDGSTLECQGSYKRGEFETRCSHLKLRPPFDLVHALAYSCNYFFSKVGEGLNQATFNSTLSSFGFGTRTGTSDEREATGSLPYGTWHVGTALGEGEELTVTPVQLLSAYSALVNGGHLFVPREGNAGGFLPATKGNVNIEPAYRSLLMDALRGVVTYGTASKTGIGALSAFTFGKTGTSTPAGTLQTDGWFVGFTSDGNVSPKAESVKLAVLVFLKHSHGSEAAAAAKSILETYSNVQKANVTPEIKLYDGTSDSDNRLSQEPGGNIRVRLVRRAVTREVSLDDYVFGVLAAEGSTETELNALKALAVVSRTYAVHNRGRHIRDQFDFCDNTHCERFRDVTDESSRPEFYALVHQAVTETSGEVLSDSENRVADAYFSAACGGMTADIGTLWGGKAPPFLKGVKDSYCQGQGYDSWSDRIQTSDLVKALRVDRRTDVGTFLRNVRVLKRDHTGRAETIELDGESRKTISGWDFKIIVGRTLGWNLLKSSKFDVSRDGSAFVFRGSGFGHGLGLCQLGAHVMAERGTGYRQIIENYFPGARIAQIDGLSRSQRSAGYSPKSLPGTARANKNAESPTPETTGAFEHARNITPLAVERVTISSENFRVTYPIGSDRHLAEESLKILEQARADANQRLAAATVRIELPRGIEVYAFESTGEFTGKTGEPAWFAAVTRNRRIESQPFAILKKRGILNTTLRHEFIHSVIEQLGGARTPRWLAEGLAEYFAGEGPMLTKASSNKSMTTDDIERQLTQSGSSEELRAAYAAAYREVAGLVRRQGEPAVWRRVAGK